MLANLTHRHNKQPDGVGSIKGSGLGGAGGVNAGEALPDGAEQANPLAFEGPSDPALSDLNMTEILNQLESEVTGRFSAPHPACDTCLHYAVRPDNEVRLMWDCYILVLVVYSSIEGPFTVAFSEKESYSLLDVVIDLSFYLDMVLSFWTGFDKGYEVIMDKRRIVKNYLEGWFLLDLIATVQWDLVIQLLGTGVSADSPMVRLSRLLKVFRLARASRLIQRISATWTLHTSFIEAAKFFFYVGIVCHLLACFFFMWPTLFDCGRDPETVALDLPGVYVEDAGGQKNALADGWEELLAEWRTDVGNQTVNLATVDGMDSIAALVDGVGWYWYGTCMQHSWRQGYGLEEICSVDRTGDGSAPVSRGDWGDSELAVLWECYVAKATAVDHKYTKPDGTKVPVRKVCVPCMRPMRLYIDAVYWSLTTMTTIGYGDRGPSTEAEILFVLFAEIFGLCVFALLLTQINTVGEVLSERENKVNDEKNGVVQFLKNQDVPPTLIDEAVRFMNFRATSLSGHAFHPENEQFGMLSPGLIEAIQNAIYRPVLENVRFFGWNQADADEHQALGEVFDEFDTGKSGALSKTGTASVFKAHNIDLSDRQMDKIFADMDGTHNGEVSFSEFAHWWFVQKTGKPRIERCPSAFLDALCTKLQTQPFAINEEMVHQGDYGKSLIILLSGSVEIDRHDQATIGKDGVEREQEHEIITHEDHEPVIGFAACLGSKQWERVRNNTMDWTVLSKTYVDTAWVARKDITAIFESVWPTGQDQMEEVAFYHYEVSEMRAPGSAKATSREKAKLLQQMRVEQPGSRPLALEGAELSSDVRQLGIDLSERIALVEQNVDTKMEKVLTAIQELTAKVDGLSF